MAATISDFEDKWLLKNVFLIDECHLVELEGWSGVALNEHVAARGLVLDRAVLLLDLHDPKTKKSYWLVCSIGPPSFQHQKNICRQPINIFFQHPQSCLPTLAVQGPRWPWAGQRACPTLILNNYNNVRLFYIIFIFCATSFPTQTSHPQRHPCFRASSDGDQGQELSRGGICI